MAGVHDKSKKRSFCSEERFRQYQLWAKITGQFVGPGTYNDDLVTQKKKALPCSAVLVRNPEIIKFVRGQAAWARSRAETVT
jgi:hypothetical protein